MIIAQLLFDRDTETHYEAAIPGTPWKCDFCLPQHRIFIEYWGTPDDLEYARRMEQTRAAYRRSGLHFVKPFPEMNET